MTQSAAGKRYTGRVVWLSLLYGLFLIGASWGFRHQAVSGLAAYVAAILPALPIIGIFAAIGRYLVEETDEYLRMLVVRQTLWASAFALGLATIWGFLESFGLAPHVEAFYVAVVWFFGLGLGAVINKVTLGAPVRC